MMQFLIHLWLSGVININLDLEMHSQANSHSKKVNSHPQAGTQVNSALGQIIVKQFMPKDLKPKSLYISRAVRYL